ncbi:MAG: hypothetical protein A2745_01485 [Candidatus Harrisonbacteria bacterium RIFCSPHIGHO2_01_FULL_44_13]|uniref:Hydrolase TatD n=1 Tax=Candidatus Harrisonbacteria bacterium RIFCSPLOWO2_01_FULL_44_18 TaxID=1798407 RepID=A0A1G1ZKX3_9BACT|nr:MAG: hypothetical protein A2745_01485 [Candidatus Harrisonbacteria bacterium RIFCSPHIGHO2_01_FULL_44_13]OGY65155.1 MAG: hypothetical protein A3A16_00445 [Candidatus Harrisonbacteria bacterium RIFCSPLOWO2_01_FULL_44_18]
MILIDSHTHIQFPVYDNDREAVIERARNAGVYPHTKRALALEENDARYGVGVKMICVGTQASTSESAIKLAEKYPEDVWATIGYHPNHVVPAQHAQTLRTGRRLAQTNWYHDQKEQKSANPPRFNIEELRRLAQHPKVVAIGECGLDYYRLAASDLPLATRVKEKQKEIFLQQVELAQELNKALMIHCRPSKGTNDAYEDLLKILQEIKFSQNVIIHFYVGSVEMARKFLDAGFYPHTKRALSGGVNGANARYGAGVYFTFGGVITFSRDYDEIIKYIPLDRILLETDAPYVAPEPYRGRRNEPAYIVETAKKLAEVKNVSFEKVAEITTKTAGQIFKLPL